MTHNQNYQLMRRIHNIIFEALFGVVEIECYQVGYKKGDCR